MYRLLHICFLSIILTCSCLATDAAAMQTEALEGTIAVDQKIEAILKELADPADVPGVVAAIAKEGQPIRIAANGVRKSGSDRELRTSNVMHLGSCTKAVTATLAGILIDQGKLRFDSTIGDVLPELADDIAPAYRSVTLYQCLTHTSGMPANANDWWLNWRTRTTIQHKRLAIARDSLKAAPQTEPGMGYNYSNLGYMVAGLMIERVTGQSWEDNIRQHIFGPLDLKTAGFGVPGTRGAATEPWGHRKSADGSFASFQKDNAPALGPAGTLYMTLEDWSRFTLLANQGFLIAQGKELAQQTKPAINLQPKTWKKLFETAHVNGKSTNYACGWMLANRPWAQGTALTHAGSNTMWYCVAWTAPETKTSYLVAMNVAGDGVSQIADQIASRLIQLDR